MPEPITTTCATMKVVEVYCRYGWMDVNLAWIGMTLKRKINCSTVKHMVSCEFIIESESYLLVIKHGLPENPPFSWMIFPFQCPFYRGFLRSPTPFLDVLRQLPGRKAVAAAILFRCAGHAGGHVVLPTGRSQRVPQIF